MGTLLQPQARAVLERHGGTVEKFIGDAVIVRLRRPFSSEDDALRAVPSRLETCGLPWMT